MCCNQRQSCNTWDWILLEEYFLPTQVDTTWCGVGQRAGCGDRSWSMDWKPSPVPDYWPHGSRLLVSPDRWLDVLTCRLLCSDEFKPNSQTFFVYSLYTKWDWKNREIWYCFKIYKNKVTALWVSPQWYLTLPWHFAKVTKFSGT